MTLFSFQKQNRKQKELQRWKHFLTYCRDKIFWENEKYGSNANSIARRIDYISHLMIDHYVFCPSGRKARLVLAKAELEFSKQAEEQNLIMLVLINEDYIVKPSNLTVNLVSNNPDWWYLRLECNPFEYTKPKGAIDIDKDRSHYLTNGGSFVIFSNQSLYNLYADNKNPKHNNLSDEEFKNYIQSLSVSHGKKHLL